MKRVLKITILFALTLSLSSCLNNWLSVNPKTEMTGDLLYSTEEGFQDALSGAYLKLKGSSAYGEKLTMTSIEHLVSSWNISTFPEGNWNLSQFNYTHEAVESELSTIYAALYNTILHVNAILDRIDEKEEVFETEGMFEIIKGESLAIRALCHLDILRLFGPIPSEATDSPILPYMTNVTRDVIPHISFNDYKRMLESDLTAAAELLKEHDPIVKTSVADLRYPQTPYAKSLSSYLVTRNFRLNYYAVQGLQARAALWFGEKGRAFELAESLIALENENGTKKFPLGQSADMGAGNLSLPNEHLFGLHTFKMADIYSNLFANGALNRGNTEYYVKTLLYGNTGTDIRETSLWELVSGAGSQIFYIHKKYQTGSVSSPLTDYRHIPIIRISELYLIAVESAPTTAVAQGYWDNFKTARNIPLSSLPTDIEQLENELALEYRKEFFAEGQAFYMYKRFNMPNDKIIFGPLASTAMVNYVLPLPKTEIVNPK